MLCDISAQRGFEFILTFMMITMLIHYLQSKARKGQQESLEAILYVLDLPVIKHGGYNHDYMMYIDTTQPAIKRPDMIKTLFIIYTTAF